MIRMFPLRVFPKSDKPHFLIWKLIGVIHNEVTFYISRLGSDQQTGGQFTRFAPSYSRKYQVNSSPYLAIIPVCSISYWIHPIHILDLFIHITYDYIWGFQKWGGVPLSFFIFNITNLQRNMGGTSMTMDPPSNPAQLAPLSSVTRGWHSAPRSLSRQWPGRRMRPQRRGLTQTAQTPSQTVPKVYIGGKRDNGKWRLAGGYKPIIEGWL